MMCGFVDGEGNPYKPSIVRLGPNSTERVKPVHIDEQVDGPVRFSLLQLFLGPISALYWLYLGIADGMSIARVWARRRRSF